MVNQDLSILKPIQTALTVPQYSHRQPGRCFKRPNQAICSHPSAGHSHRITHWIDSFSSQKALFTAHQAESMAKLLPLLICGEQSAQLVFNQEINRLIGSGKHKVSAILQEVEADEYRHDMALQLVANQVSGIDGFKQIQRHARRFYAGLGRVEHISEHFVRIAMLDTCVTQIMKAFAQCNLGDKHLFAQLCGLIKKDEAKHVYVSRHYAKLLGATSDDFELAHYQVVEQLFSLLLTQHAAFESMGVCLDALQQKLEDKWL